MNRGITIVTIAACAAIGGIAFCVSPLSNTLYDLTLGHPAAAAARTLPDAPADTKPQPDGVIVMDENQMRQAGIRVAPAASGRIAHHIQVPGTVVASADRLVRVPARVSGIVTELLRRPGDQVAAGDLLAVVESREMADAKAEFLAAQRRQQLAQITLERERSLWNRRISAEQDFLKARADAQEAGIRLDLAQQKLSTLGLGPDEITALSRQPAATLARREIRAPIAGRVTERTVDLGGAVSPETQMFAVVDLSVVWVETAVAALDLAFVHEGQTVQVTGPVPGLRTDARLIFISPSLDSQTRAAHAVAEMPNAGGGWRPGIFVTAAIQTSEQPVEVMVPRDAIQTVDGGTVVFVRTQKGFEKRQVRLGQGDDRSVEVVSGVAKGEPIVIANTFLLKAELGKSAASED